MKKVLIVDNDPQLLKYMERKLSAHPYNVTTAQDGVAALSLLDDIKPDIIFTDLIMPNLDGDKLCQIIRNLPIYKHTFIVIMSGAVAEMDFDHLAFGANACIAKTSFKEMIHNMTALIEKLDQESPNTPPFFEVINKEKVYKRRITQELISKNQHMTQILSQISDGIIEIIQPDARILYMNKTAQKLLATTEEAVLFHPIASLFSEDQHHLLDRLIASENKSIPPIQHRAKFLALNTFSVEDNPLNRIVVIRDLTDQVMREKIYIQMKQELHRRQIAEKNMEKAKQAAEEANKAKSEFLANISHEIRTPMNSIMGMADLLLESPLNREQKKYVHIYRKAGENLLEIINDLLDLASVEAGRLELDHQCFKLRELLASVCDAFQAKTPPNSLTLSYKVHANIPEDLIGDPLRLKQIIANLLSNAIKFSSNGEIWLTCHSLNPHQKGVLSEIELLFAIKDPGIGISPERQQNIFETFTKADASSTREYGGTGMGLAICKRLVELMGGRIWVESQVKKGSTFFFSASFTRQSSPRDRHTPLLIPKSFNVLLVEDTLENQQLFKMFLKKTALKIDMAENGQIGFEKYTSGNYDLVFMDKEMPVMDGNEAIQKIRAWEVEKNKVPAVPIISLTAHAVKGAEAESFYAGCTDYLTKPLKKQQLFEILKRYYYDPLKTE